MFFSQKLITKFAVSSIIINVVDVCGLYEMTAYCFVMSFDYIEDLLCVEVILNVRCFICLFVCLLICFMLSDMERGICF